MGGCGERSPRAGRHITGGARQWRFQASHCSGFDGIAKKAGSLAVDARLPIRQKGGGRKKASLKDPDLLLDLEKLLEPVTRGGPQSPLRWTCKSVRNLADELRAQGHEVGCGTVARTEIQPAGEPQDEGEFLASGPQCAV